jgi:LacI family transcriptional regulator
MPIDSREIATRAGVSQSTVSRVINNRPGVREEIRQRVLKLIAEVGYYPNAGARSLVTSKTSKIGLLVSGIINPFYPELVESVEAFAREEGYNVLLCNLQRDPSMNEIYTRLLIEQRVAGVIISSITLDSEVHRQFSRAGIPVVFVNRHPSNTQQANAVVTDNVGGAYKITKHLIELGHSRIAFIRGLLNTSTSLDREAGYRQCLADHGLEFDGTLLEQGDYYREKAYEATVRFRQLPHPPTAVFCANDYMAYGALDAATDLGLRVPEDLSVVGFDNISFSSLKVIALTTVEQPITDMARKAMEILLDCITGEEKQKFRTVVYDSELIVRDTSGPVPP